ncbi:TPR-like protein [Microstroma glucosiphilum]|uniref:TPR-like protein n=1 Tax=Pseudomicrostroma glucosiphilum TaxID=1684307 RepID=A0A316U3D6_9BASI|nr:TPR-like protein [Pseudomicrostroma glucosiphilum]PWN18991.1 TPR-like protein [Pseudomicrostroma glucosiphilum]
MSRGTRNRGQSGSPSDGSDGSYEEGGGAWQAGLAYGSDSDYEGGPHLGPLDGFSEMDSGDEWRPSDASDTDDEAQGGAGPSRPRQDRQVLDRQQQKGYGSGVPTSAVGRGQARGLSAAQRRRLALDALGSDAWKDSSQRKRQQAPAAGPADDEHEVEEAELGRLVAGLGIPSAPRVEDEHAEVADGAALQSEMLAASGFKSQRKKTRRTTAQAAVSPEVARLLSEANLAYVNMELEEAIEKLQEVIRIDPTVKSAWSTLANCFREQGDFERETQAKSIEAILTPRATDLWISLAHRHDELGQVHEAIKCFERAIRTSREKDRSDVLDAMWDRACLLRDLEDDKAALTAFKALLRVRPHNAEVLAQLVPLCLKANRRMEAIRLLESSWEFNRTHFPDPTSGEGLRFASFTGSEIVTLCDLLLLNNEPLAALNIVRQGSRWLQGRSTEIFWDDVLDDDREFDESREGANRGGVAEYGRRVEMAPVYPPLDTQLRLRLGYARAKMEDLPEAERHFELYLAKTDPADYTEQYIDLVELDMELGQFEQANAILLRMMELDFLLIPDIIYKHGLCLQALGQNEAAAGAFEAVIANDPANLEVKLRLAETYEALGRVEDAMNTVNEFLAARAEQRAAQGAPNDGDHDSQVPPAPAASDILDGASRSGAAKTRKKKLLRADERERLAKAREEEANLFLNRLQKREAEIFVEGWWRNDVVIGISGLDPASELQERYGIDIGEDEQARIQRFAATRDWLDLSGRLIDSFRSMPHMFPRSRSGSSKTGPSSTVEARLRSSGQRTPRRPYRKRDVDLGARDLISRLQDRVMHDSAMHEDDAGEDALDSTGAGAQATAAMAGRHFRGMDYDMWTDMFVKHAFVLTKIGDHGAASDLLEHVLSSHVATSSESRRMTLTLAQAACGFYARDFSPPFEVLRQLTSHWQFHNMPIRLLASLSHISGFYGLDAYTSHKIQKLLVRRSRVHEVIVNNGKWEYAPLAGRYVARERLQAPQRSLGYCKNREPFVRQDEGGDKKKKKRKKVKSAGTKRSAADEDADDAASDDSDDANDGDDASADEEGLEDDLDANGEAHASTSYEGTSAPREKPPTKEGIIGEIAYGYFLLVTSSWQSALGISLRAYARAPNEPVVCLMAAVACFGRMTNRQTDNRHHLLLQGISFLSLYRKYRIAEVKRGATEVSSVLKPTAWIEAEYNIGRGLHQAGLITEAVQAYERVLQAHDERVSSKVVAREAHEVGFDCYREAAWNLSLIYSINGNGRAARVLMNKYLRVC